MREFDESGKAIQPRSEVVKSTTVEQSGLIPMKVNDLRDPRFRAFDLDKFIGVIGRLKGEGLFKISHEFEDSDYGKYMSVFASSESDNWNEAIQKAQAIEITASTPPSRGYESFEGRTRVEVKVLMTGNEGRVFDFNFRQDGKYSNGGWRSVQLQRRLSLPGDDQNFTLDIEAETNKKLE